MGTLAHSARAVWFLQTYQSFLLFLDVLHLDAFSDGPFGCIIQISRTSSCGGLAHLLGKKNFDGLVRVPIRSGEGDLCRLL